MGLRWPTSCPSNVKARSAKIPRFGIAKIAKMTSLMNLDGIRDQLTPVFRDVMDRDDIVLSDTLTADDVEEWDSLSHIRLMVTIEKQFSVRFTNAEIEGLKDVGELVRLIAKKKQDQTRAGTPGG